MRLMRRPSLRFPARRAEAWRISARKSGRSWKRHAVRTSRKPPMPEWDSGQREAYLTLALVPGIGFARLGALLERFETPSGVLAAPLAHLAEVPGMSPAAATAIQQADHNTGARAQAELLQLG